MIIRGQLKHLLVLVMAGVGHAVQESLEVTNNSSDDKGSDNDSYGYSDYTMGTGDTDQSSQGESDLGDSNISL